MSDVTDIPGFRIARLFSLEILLPTTFNAPKYVSEVLVADELRRRAQQAALDAKASSSSSVTANPSSRQTGSMPQYCFPASPSEHLEASRLEAEGKRALRRQRKLSKSLRLMPVYRPDEPAKLIRQYLNSSDKAIKERLKHWFLRLNEAGHLRELIHLQPTHVRSALAQLRVRHPHFWQVLDMVDSAVEVALLQKCPVKLPPILLYGEPGVGKSHFVKDLAQALGLPLDGVHFDAGTFSSKLTGTDRHWSNNTPGLLFDKLCLGKVLNPLIVLEELDKAHMTTYGNSALEPLHTLLEPVTSKMARDTCVDMVFDASWVTWLATANNIQRVPASIQSRFVVVRIEHPNAEQSIQVASSVAVAVHEQFAHIVSNEPSRAVLVAIAALTPREMRQVLEQAYTRAVVNGCSQVLAKHLPAELLGDPALDDDGNPITVH